ncbi:MAG TPA: DMT family transporter [Candidatus Dormibacteraeota bacterium]|nr:DMT family transporter [Candidatus Dormibacteraeota bacterium]
MNAAGGAVLRDHSLERRRLMLRGIGVILCGSVLLGAMAVAVRVATRTMDAGQVAFARFLGSFLILLALRGGRSLRPRGTVPPVLLRGLFGGGAILLYYRAIESAGAGLATLLHCTYPIWTTVIATTVLGERFDARLAAALALFIAGIAVVVAPGADLSQATTIGSLYALTASMLAGAAVSTARQLRAVESAYLVTTYFMAVGAALTAPALLRGLPPISGQLVVILMIIVLTSVAGQLLLHLGLGFAPAIQASLAAATAVVSATAFAGLLLGEHLDPHTLLGAGVLVVAIGLAVGRR